MACPYLKYRESDDEQSFDHERPYCAIQGSFVSPMQADVCNNRFEYHHETHCDVYRQANEEVTGGARGVASESQDVGSGRQEVANER